MTTTRRSLAACLLALAATASARAEEPGVAQRTGRALDRGARRTGNAVGRGVQNTGNAARRVGNWTANRTQRVGRSLGASN